MPKWDNFKWQKPTNTPWHRTTEWEILERVSQVARLIIQWYQRFEIIPIFQTKYWLSVTQIDDYIAKSKKRIKAKNDEMLENELWIVEARITDMYQWARKWKKWSDVWKAIKLHMELKWLEAPKKFIINPISDEDKKKVEMLLDNNIFWIDDLSNNS